MLFVLLLLCCVALAPVQGQLLRSAVAQVSYKNGIATCDVLNLNQRTDCVIYLYVNSDREAFGTGQTLRHKYTSVLKETLKCSAACGRVVWNDIQVADTSMTVNETKFICLCVGLVLLVIVMIVVIVCGLKRYGLCDCQRLRDRRSRSRMPIV